MDRRPQIVAALAESRPDLEAQTIGFLRRRAFDAVRMVIAATERPHVSRLTFTVPDDPDRPEEAERLVRELGRMLYVLEIERPEPRELVRRELLLVKVAASPTERASVAQVCEVFRARIVDVGPSSVIVEATGDSEKLDGLLGVLQPFGIQEMNRTRAVTLGRGDAAMGQDLRTSSWRQRQLAATPRH